VEPRAEWVTAPPATPLRAFVDRYVGYRLSGFSSGLHRGLASRHMTFIVSIGPPINVVSQADARQSPASYRCVLSGLQASPASISHEGNQEGIAVELSPLGCRSLFGMPARALWNTSVECAEITGPAGRELWERLQPGGTWSERFAACDEVLSRLARDDLLPAPQLVHAWRSVVGAGGTASVGALAAELGWTRQHLTRRFGDEFGLGPKLAGRIVRFERARRMFQAAPSSVTLASVAAACGYYDQAHLNRDFTQLAGCPPTTWMDEELPSFQDDDAVVV
jgi:AraC-like DNA-binding protein